MNDLISFASDNHAGAHPEVLRAMEAANVGYAAAYGGDPLTASLRELFKQTFGHSALGFPVFNGTGANVVALSAGLKRYQGILCAAAAHIDADECGAPERLGGFKLFPIPTTDQKLTVDRIAPLLSRRGDTHAVQPRGISITQSTELGTVYTLAEIRALSQFARAEGLFLHMDGARIANAAAALGCSLKECTTDVGVDVLSFGATKNGAISAEAVIALSPEFVATHAEDLRYVQKQCMQLASKARFISAQLKALLENDLWRRNAEQANAMAKLLAEGVKPFAEIVHPVEANAVFARIPVAAIPSLQNRFPFYTWEEASPARSADSAAAGVALVRWMTSFQTKEADVRQFIDALQASLA